MTHGTEYDVHAFPLRARVLFVCIGVIARTAARVRAARWRALVHVSDAVHALTLRASRPRLEDSPWP